jgi:hypothetical protein
MLLTETYNISNNTLSENFGLSVSGGETSTSLSDSSILPRHDARGFTDKHPETLKMTYEADKCKRHSGGLIKVGNLLLFSLP